MTTISNIINVTQENFQTGVIDASMTKLILVDFWADWCQPCQSLIPILEKLAGEYANEIVLAKVNSDANQELAAHFQVRSLPTVKFFKKGALVNEFMGVQAESAIREMIEQHIEKNHESETNPTLKNATDLLQSGDDDKALEMLQLAHQNEDYNKDCILLMAQIYCHKNELDKASKILESLNTEDHHSVDAIKILFRIKISRILAHAPPQTELMKMITPDPENLQLLLWSSAYNLLDDHYETALEILLRILTTDKNFQDNIAKQLMVDTFNLLENQGSLVSSYRRKMASLLY